MNVKFESIVSMLLKPIVRLSVNRGLRLQELVSCLKRALLEVSREELEKSGAGVNISRLALFSGLQRKEIRELTSTAKKSSSSVNLLSRVVGQWQLNPQYTTKTGDPKPLHFEGRDSEFAELVRSISADLSPYTVLFALEQIGAIEKRDSKLILKTAVFEPAGDDQLGLEMLAQDSESLIEAVQQNIFKRDEVPNLHITTTFDNICEDQVSEIREWILDKGTTFHEEIREYLSQRDKDANPRLFRKAGGAKVSVCAFSFAESPQKTTQSAIIKGNITNGTKK